MQDKGKLIEVKIVIEKADRKLDIYLWVFQALFEVVVLPKILKPTTVKKIPYSSSKLLKQSIGQNQKLPCSFSK